MRIFFQKRTLLVVSLAFVISYSLWSYLLPSQSIADAAYDFSTPPPVHHPAAAAPAPVQHDEQGNDNTHEDTAEPNGAPEQDRDPNEDPDQPRAKKPALRLDSDIDRVHKALNKLDKLAVDAMLPPPPPQAANATHLVLVPGHAVFLPRRGPHALQNPDTDAQALAAGYPSDQPPLNVFGSDSDEGDSAAGNGENWLVAPFQRGQTATFARHVRAAATIARRDRRAVLVLSGGQTNVLAGPYSEGASYWSLAAFALNEYDVPQETDGGEDGKKEETTLVNRMIAEEHATDSYENLLFSIARFKEYVGRYPELITVVGLDLKRERFATVHRAAIRFPASQFRYVGIDPPELYDEAPQGEKKKEQEQGQENAQAQEQEQNKEKQQEQPEQPQEQQQEQQEQQQQHEAQQENEDQQEKKEQQEREQQEHQDQQEKSDQPQERQDPPAPDPPKENSNGAPQKRAPEEDPNDRTPTLIKGERYAAAAEGERQNALLPFSSDPYGCTDPVLTAKRRSRNPFRRSNPYLLSCPELYELFTVCARDNLPKEEVFRSLPWNAKPPGLAE